MAIAPPLLQLEDISLTFGGKPLLGEISCAIHRGDRVALVGRNGCGKSTLLKIMAGITEPSSGEITSERNTTLRYLPQIPDLEDHPTLGAYVLSGLGPLDDSHQALQLLAGLGLDEASPPKNLSGGELRRAALAKTLAAKPDILLLDEPTNHLDLPTIEWLESELARNSAAMVIISHDRRFLENTTTKTFWIDRGQMLENNAGFDAFEDWRDKVLEEEERDLHKLKRKIVREEHWLTYGVSARRKRNMRRLGDLHSLRADYRNHERAQGTAKLEASDAATSGKLVIEAEGLNLSFGDFTPVAEFFLRVHRGDRIGLVGPNGAGKTTLIKLLTGELNPDSGTIRIGANLQRATLDQKRDGFDGDETLEHFLTDGRGQSLVVNGAEKHVQSYMQDFLFKPEQARTPMRELSGGERARLMLAKILAKPANFLVLDEPTNDLDMETLDLLQELVASFDGTVILVSHDRDFLDRTVGAVIAPDPNTPGKWITYAGGYSDMLAQRGSVDGLKRAERAAQKREKTASETPVKARPSGKAKMSYKDKYALETLPAEIEQMETEIAQLSAELADPDLFSKMPARFVEASKLLATKQADRDAKEERWLELEMLREEMESS